MHVFTIQNPPLDKWQSDLEAQGFELKKPPYTHFQAIKKGVSCTLYLSGKCVVQGKEAEDYIRFYLEPQILKEIKLGYEHVGLNTEGRIGIDESGKGDFFGPLCIAGVFAEGKQIEELLRIGVKDSKTLSDAAILKLATAIRKICTHHIVRINPAKYNQLYSQFGNLNKLLAWGHATSIDQLVQATNCKNIVVDQFASEHVVLTALKRKQLNLSVTQRHRAEEDVVVAAASILARAAFLDGLAALSKKYEVELPKGASAKTIAAGKQLVRTYGEDVLTDVCKQHFKTLDAIL